jgi:hypothetical protein
MSQQHRHHHHRRHWHSSPESGVVAFGLLIVALFGVIVQWAPLVIGGVTSAVAVYLRGTWPGRRRH